MFEQEDTRVETERKWSDHSILKSISNPSPQGQKRAQQIQIKNPELTFMGAKNQPDFGEIYITMYPREIVIELKSLKLYFFQFRDKRISYERLIEVIYEDLKTVYDPIRLRIVTVFNTRGGMSSKHTIDSDWAVRGGNEEFQNRIDHGDVW
ncbi:MAG: preQ(1) synthase [bacterium]|nr:preQ(1) synthase [bacterium]